MTRQLTWLSAQKIDLTALGGVPDVKAKHFAAEAKTLDAARMTEMEQEKRYTLAVALFAAQSARTRDDIAEMFIKRMQSLHKRAKEALAAYWVDHQERTDHLILTLRDLVAAYQQEGEAPQRFAAMEAALGGHAAEVLQDCEAHLAYAGNNYYPFLWRFYKSHRAVLFRLLKLLTLRSTTQDTTLEQAIRFLLDHERSTAEQLKVADKAGQPLLDLAWVPDGWWRILTGQRARRPIPEQVNRRHFEVCLFSQVMWDLKAGDLFIEGSDRYADYRAQQISVEEYDARVKDYGELVNLPVDGPAFVGHVQNWLEEIAQRTDASFPDYKHVRLEAGRPVLRRLAKAPTPAGLAVLEQHIDEGLAPVSILDVIGDTAAWLDWPRYFGPISGFDDKLDDPVARYITTAFCYGCQLWPSQTARALPGIDRRQIGWINQRHVDEEKLDQAIECVIRAYQRFSLPKLWGSNQHAGADGTQWDLYERNLMAEQHIRYGGYGGIGYYHVSDTYIALFSNFIACGVWEGVYILDLFEKYKTIVQPSVLHSDTHGQNAPLFGLAYLMGITLMPRIRDWQGLKFYRPSPTSRYQHIDGLFSEVMDWEPVATHLPDMLRVVLSFKAGKLLPSTLLHRLSSYSYRNRLYQAFRGLGCAIRTGYLLRYMSDPELQATTLTMMNKNESFNHFSKWVGFGSAGVITENIREEQQKVIKYNHLIANCLIFYNTFALSRLLTELVDTGHKIDPAAVAAISPYITKHINRFGNYNLDRNRQPPPLTYELPVLTAKHGNSIVMKEGSTRMASLAPGRR